ncbi:MAG: TIR domain-containing protein [Sedimentibacter sp.]
MSRKVFFSFHYDNDVNRAMTVRNSWVTQGVEKAGFVDKVEFEKIQRQGTKAIENWIDNQLIGTSVTVVLIGSETLERDFVQYEIRKSIEKGNGIIGVKINSITDMRTGFKTRLCNLHTCIGIWTASKKNIYFDEIADGIYDYSTQDGYHKLGAWIESAAKKKGK